MHHQWAGTPELNEEEASQSQHSSLLLSIYGCSVTSLLLILPSHYHVFSVRRGCTVKVSANMDPSFLKSLFPGLLPQ